MYNETISAELELQIEELLLKMNEFNNPDAAIYCGKEIIRRAFQKSSAECTIIKPCVNDYSSFIPAY